MRDRKWLRDNTSDDSSCLHSGPFLPCTNKAHMCDIRGLKCIACVCAKAHRRSSTHAAFEDPDHLRRFTHRINGTLEKVLKTDHTSPGDCISADHYLSPVAGHMAENVKAIPAARCLSTMPVVKCSTTLNFPRMHMRLPIVNEHSNVLLLKKTSTSKNTILTMVSSLLTPSVLNVTPNINVCLSAVLVLIIKMALPNVISR